MSEATTAPSSAVTAPASPGSDPNAPNPNRAEPNPAANAGANGGANPGPAAGDAAQAAEMRRILGEQDFDAEVPLKIDGKEKSAKLRDLVAFYQRNESATQRFQEAAHARQEAARLKQEAEARARAMTQALQDPGRFRAELQALGMSPRELAERVLQQEIEEASLTPEQRERRQLQAELEQLRAVREQEQQRQIQAQAQHLRGQYEAWFGERMGEAGIPDIPQIRGVVLGEMVRHFDAVLQSGGKVTPSEMRELAGKIYGQIVTPWRERLSDDERRAMLRDEDFAWYQQRKAGSVPQAMPAAQPHHAQTQPRDESGKFAPNGRPVRRVFDGDAGFARLLNGR